MSKQRKQSKMYPLVQEYLSSEVSQREFCQGHQIKVHTFQYWLSKYKQEQIKENHVDKFIPIEINDPPALLNQIVRISYPSGMTIEFPVL
jgi:transposase-like protein